MQSKKKICLISLRNIYMISCLPRYVECFGENKFDIIYWDRHGMEENCGADNHYSMKHKITNGDSKWRKLLGYLKFIRYVTSILKKNNYEKVILLPTQTGILLYPFLKKKYSNKYIIDIRDYTAENNKLFYMLQTKLIKNSGLAAITSKGFEKFLPEHEYLVSHNTSYVPEKLISEYRMRKKKTGDKIIISCIGGIRFYEQFKKVISYFKNDDRYLLRFIGNGSEGLKEYCEQNNIQNVELVGRFTPDKTWSFYLDTDIIMNLYGNNTPLLDYALSNKLYYAATFGMPILVCPDTYMEEVAVGNGFGFTFDLEEKNMCHNLYNYYQSIDWTIFYQNCDHFMKKVNYENDIFQDSVRNFISYEKK